MTRDDIIRIAQEAAKATNTIVPPEFETVFVTPFIERFAALVAAPLEEEIKRLRFCIPEGDAAAAMEYLAHCVDQAVEAEREACAKVCEEIKWSMWEKHTKHGETRFQDVSDGASVCTYAIRARGNK